MATTRNTWLILVLALFQVLSSTYLLRLPAFSGFNSILFLLSGVAISLLLTNVPEIFINVKAGADVLRSMAVLKILTVLILLPFGYHYCRQIMDATPIAIENADMLPIIDAMGKRFLDGQLATVYQPIPEIWNGIQPIYPSVLWMSFLPALLFDFDLRWITVIGIYLSVILSLVLLQVKEGLSVVSNAMVIAAITILLVWLHTDVTNNVIRLTEEGVVYFYYCLLVLAIASGNAWLIGMAAAFCLLSRFAVVGWLPCLALHWILTKNYVQLGKAMLSGALVVFFLLILPFGWQPVQLFISLPGKYVVHAKNVWETFPDHFNRSLGMAKFFGKNGVELLHNCLMITTFLVPLLFVALHFFQKKKRPANNLLLASLNLTLTMFYNFIDVSYLYLYYTPVFVSLLITSLYLANQRGASEKRMISSR